MLKFPARLDATFHNTQNEKSGNTGEQESFFTQIRQRLTSQRESGREIKGWRFKTPGKADSG